MHPFTRRAFTLSELLALIAAGTLLLAVTLPVIARGSSYAQIGASMDNITTIGMAHIIYAADYNGRQMTATPDDLAAYGNTPDSAITNWESQNDADYPPIYAGWGPDITGKGFYHWGYFPGGSSGHSWAVYPITFGYQGLVVDGFGMFRMLHQLEILNQYLDGRYYNPDYFAPADAIPIKYASPAFDLPWGFVPTSSTNGEQVWSSYCLSPAAMFHPDVFRAPDQGGWQFPFSIDHGFESPGLFQAKHPSLKTHILEFHWIQNAPADVCNPQQVPSNRYGDCSPYLFNHGLASEPVTLFYDFSVRLLPNAEAIAADKQHMNQVGYGLWSRDTEYGEFGYFGDYSYDGTNTSHHIFTTEGILGRDTFGE